MGLPGAFAGNRCRQRNGNLAVSWPSLARWVGEAGASDPKKNNWDLYPDGVIGKLPADPKKSKRGFPKQFKFARYAQTTENLYPPPEDQDLSSYFPHSL